MEQIKLAESEAYARTRKVRGPPSSVVLWDGAHVDYKEAMDSEGAVILPIADAPDAGVAAGSGRAAAAPRARTLRGRRTLVILGAGASRSAAAGGRKRAPRAALLKGREGQTAAPL